MKTALLITSILFSSFFSYAQKIKYKDLFVLLRAKNYQDGASFLKNYIITNPEHPNANYQMGLMLDFKVKELDLLKESDEIVARADSAIMYFDKAYTFITPKEVKKHDDDYYELFKRRNLRTGKFEVILSDVQLDIENRKNALQTVKVDVSSINQIFNSSISFYEQARTSYKELRETFFDELSLSLGAVDTTVNTINSMVLQYDSALINYKKYKKLKESFEGTASELIITNKSIEAFAKEALRKPDFYAKKVDFYNFSEWATSQVESINDRKVFIEHLIEFDVSLKSIEDKIFKDSVDLTSEIFRKITLPVLKELKALDPESLLTDVYQYKISQLNYNSLLMNWYNQYADSLDVGLQLDFLSKLNDQIKGVEKLESKLHEFDKNGFLLRYHKIIDGRYSSSESFFGYLNNQASVITGERKKLDSLSALVEENDKWGYWKEDTVSLTLMNDPLKKYIVFYSDSLENRAVKIAGLTSIGDKNNFFFSMVPSSRVIDSLYFSEALVESMDLNSPEFIVQAESSTADQTIYLIGVPKEEKYSLQLIYIHHTNGIIWNNPIWLDITPPPILSLTDEYIEITQGELITKYQFSDGQPVVETELTEEE